MFEYRKKCKILFISINSVWRYGNIGMDQLLGYLREKGFEIDIQYFKNRDKAKDIYERLSDVYQIYAFSVHISNYGKCVEIASLLKQKDERNQIVFGGGYPTRYYKEILKETDCIDYMVLGDGECPSEYLYDSLAKRLYEQNSNIMIRHESVVTRNDYEGKRDFFNKEITWNPAYDYYEKDSKQINSRKVHCIQIKNNVCTGNCSFCTERHGKVVFKDIKNVVDQIEYVYQNYKVEKVYFTDDNIFDPNTDYAKKHVQELCLELERRNMKLAYQCYIKAFSFSDTPEDHELLKLMRRVGFVEMFIGIEAGNQDDLDLYNKFTTVDQNYKIIEILKKHDIFPIMGYIAFNPYSTKKKIKLNFEYLCETQCTYLHNYLYSFAVINKYTDMYEMIKRDGLLLSDESVYVDVRYAYANQEVDEVLEYVRNEMLPKLRLLDYELDWVIYSAMEHEISHSDKIMNYRPLLEKQKEKDALWIKKHLKYLFVDFNINKFKLVEDKFWDYFKQEEIMLKKIYEHYISLHWNI